MVERSVVSVLHCYDFFYSSLTSYLEGSVSELF